MPDTAHLSTRWEHFGNGFNSLSTQTRIADPYDWVISQVSHELLQAYLSRLVTEKVKKITPHQLLFSKCQSKPRPMLQSLTQSIALGNVYNSGPLFNTKSTLQRIGKVCILQNKSLPSRRAVSFAMSRQVNFRFETENNSRCRQSSSSNLRMKFHAVDNDIFLFLRKWIQNYCVP